MARVTVEKSLEKMGNRFDLILVAARRARQIAIEGKEPKVDMGNDKPTVVALREIELGLVNARTVEEDDLREQHAQEQVDFSNVANILADQ